MSKEKVLHSDVFSHTRKSSKTFAAPDKEQATTGRFMPAGDNYGVGHANPIGTFRVTGMAGGPIPQTSVCFDPSDAVK